MTTQPKGKRAPGEETPDPTADDPAPAAPAPAPSQVVIVLSPDTPANDADAGTGISVETVLAYIVRPETRQHLLDRAKKKVRRQDAENMVQSTFVRARTARSRPTSEETMAFWLDTLFDRTVADHYEALALQKRAEAMFVHREAVPDTTDGTLGDPRDIKPWIAREAAKHPKDLETLDLIRRKANEHLSYEALAAELGTTPNAVKKRFARFGDKYAARHRRHLAIIGIVLGLLLVATIAAAYFLLRSRAPRITPEPPYTPPPTAPVRTDQDIAKDLRDDAYGACAASRWDECRDKLDDAWRIDPAGDTSPRVLEARRAIKEGTRRAAPPPSAKPPTPKPPSDKSLEAIPGPGEK